MLLFLSEAVKCYYSQAFWVKMAVLPVALLFTFVVRQRVALGALDGTATRRRVTGAVSLALWFTVAAAGRWIGFSSRTSAAPASSLRPRRDRGRRAARRCPTSP